MKFLVLGVGSIGCRHIRNLQALGHTDILAYDVDRAALTARCAEFGVQVVDDYVPHLDSIDALIVCSPPSKHVDVAMAAARKGKYVFVEKPISNDLAAARTLLDVADRIMVGYNVRYHPLVAIVRDALSKLGTIYNVQMEFAYSLANARPHADYRKGYYAQAGEGGVLFDHIHELDYAYHLFGRFNEVYCDAGKLSDLEIQSEDNANLVLKSAQGFPVTLHIDYNQQRYARSIKIVAQHGVLLGDYAAGRASLWLNGKDEQQQSFDPSFDQTYVSEMKDFIAAVKAGTPPPISVASALHSLELAHAAHASNRDRQAKAL